MNNKNLGLAFTRSTSPFTTRLRQTVNYERGNRLCFGHLKIRILKLFSAWDLEIRIWPCRTRFAYMAAFSSYCLRIFEFGIYFSPDFPGKSVQKSEILIT
jgi:hypothetical protein